VKQRDVIIGALDRGLKALELQLPQLGKREKIRGADRVKSPATMRRVFAHNLEIVTRPLYLIAPAERNRNRKGRGGLRLSVAAAKVMG
jgi:hypothetical protein